MNEEFKAQFNLPVDGFGEPIDLTDTRIGFSLFKKGIQEGFKSLFRVYIKDADLDKPGDLKPLIITAAYGRENENGITISSSDMKTGLRWPIELISSNQYSYNIRSKRFFYKDRNIDALSILKKTSDLHLKPLKPIKGFLLRLEIFLRREFLTYIPLVFIGLLYFISGDKVNKNIWLRVIEKRTTKTETTKNFEEKDSKKLDIFGYKASRWAVMLYCILHLSIYIFAKKLQIKSGIVIGVFANSFLIVMYVIPTLGFLDYLLPKILRYLIEKTTDFAVWGSSKTIKI